MKYDEIASYSSDEFKRVTTLITATLCLLALLLFSGCNSINPSEGQLPERPALPEGMPDLTKGEGPDAKKVSGPHHLLNSTCRAWVYRDKNGNADNSRQILLTWVQSDRPVWRSLKVGDVILGINGRYFSEYPINEFRKGQSKALKTEGTFDVILWRKGWDKERIVTVDLGFKVLDFTKGDIPGTASDWNLGPTGARGWMQGRYNESYEARQILITNVEKGSPADGILKKGDVILGLDGKNFDSDARRAFGRAITKAETKSGKGILSVRRWRSGTVKDITIKIPVMGSYSETTPWNCKKSAKILEGACRYLIKKDILNRGNKKNPTEKMLVEKTLAALAFLSTGKKEHLNLAKGFIYKLADKVAALEKEGKNPPHWCYGSWGWGYYNLLLTSYYLLTKDPKVLPAIRRYSTLIAEGQSGVGSWGHGMSMPNHGRIGGYGAMNQAGTICWMSLILATKCGITNPEIEQAIKRGKIYLDHFIDRQNVPYGDGIIVSDPRLHDDNGKSSAAAAAYSMIDDRKGTEFFSKMTIASWAVREFGHTGNLWSMLWGPLGAQRAGNDACSAFLHQQSWYFDLERRWDGGFTYAGKMGYRSGFDYKTGITKGSAENQYSGWDTTASRILMYTLPLKLLTISGNDTLVIPLKKDKVAELIEDGRPTPDGIQYHAGNITYLKDKFADKSPEELFELLESWSPVVRQQAAVSLASRDGDYTEKLIEKLKSQNRFARYGGCMAVKELGPRATGAVKTMIPLLKADDEAQFAYAAFALSATHDKEAVDSILKQAVAPYLDDPNDYHLRVIGLALFSSKGALNKSIDGVDRTLLVPAVKRIMTCKGGAARHYAARAVLNKLDFKELSGMWPTMVYSLNEYPLTEVAFGTAGQMTIAEIISKYKVKEGMPLILEHLKRQKRHGSQKRHQTILAYLTAYGKNAQVMLPELETYYATITKDPLKNQHFYMTMIPYLEEAIKTIKESKKEPQMKSIKAYLK